MPIQYSREVKVINIDMDRYEPAIQIQCPDCHKEIIIQLKQAGLNDPAFTHKCDCGLAWEILGVGVY